MRSVECDDLALQVRRVDDVHVDDAERADAGRREVERGGRAEAAGADQQHARVEQLQLALLADLGDQEVAAVALALLGVERARELGREAVALPVGEAAGERDDVLVAELARASSRRTPSGRRRRSRRRSAASRSGASLLDARLEVAARDVDAPGMWPSPHSSCSRTSTRSGGRRRRGARARRGASTSSISAFTCCEQLAIARHDFQKYSDGCRATPLPAMSAAGRAPARRPSSPLAAARRGRRDGRRARSSDARRDAPADVVRSRGQGAPLARPRRADGSRGAALRRAASTTAGTRRPRRSSRAPRLARGADRRGVRALAARELDDAEAARRGEPAERARRSSISGSRLLGGPRRRRRRAWRRAARLEPDTPSAVDAADFLHPRRRAPGSCRRDRRRRSPRSSSQPARARRRRIAHASILYGSRSGSSSPSRRSASSPRPPRSRRTTRRARRGGRRRVLARRNPSRPFSQLGPLTAAFPKAATVRFHLGLLLLWTRQVTKAQGAAAAGRRDRAGIGVREARRRQLLAALAGSGSK